VWSAAYNQMELQFDRQSFDTMMRDARLLDYEADTKTLVIKVANPYARDMLQHRLYRNVQRILRDVSGTELAARFEAKQTEDPLKRFLLRDSKNEVYPQ
jgi:chromosomal replication initiation ATPase DnaA